MPKVNENFLIFSIASLLFTANQLIEFLLIKLFKANYSDLCIWDCWWYSGLVLNHYDTEPHAHPKMNATNWAFFLFSQLRQKYFFHYNNLCSNSIAYDKQDIFCWPYIFHKNGENLLTGYSTHHIRIDCCL